MRSIFRFLLLTGFVCLFRVLNAQSYNEILGRPTNESITISFLPDQSTEVFWEYGTSSGSYPLITSTYTVLTDSVLETGFSGLTTDTKYFYRTRYRLSGSSSAFQTGPEHTFHTARPTGRSFSFAIEADPHLDTNSLPASYSLTLQNILSAQPDFMMDLGDNFMSEKLTDYSQAQITARHLLYRPYFGSVCHSVPLYITIGNHEGELGWMLDGTPNSLPVRASNTRKQYYPNPLPGTFYYGDTIQEPYVGLRENYYAWQWGDALFIVLDPYWYTLSKPEWGWTLGEAQYQWFRHTISTSNAKFKFVFCHQLVGGNGTDGRGGSEYAGFFENGGENSDSTWGFDTHRPTWQSPVHKLMVDNNASVFFHGHDHCFAKQDKDGVVYQEVPQPSSKNISQFTGSAYGYVKGMLLPSRGYLLVSVTDTCARVDYIKTFLPGEETGGHTNGEIAYSYTINSSAASPTLGVAPLSRNVPDTPGSTNFNVSSNTGWNAASDKSWCSVTTFGSGNGTLTATCSQNLTGSERTATITVTVSGFPPQQVTVTQAVAPPPVYNFMLANDQQVSDSTLEFDLYILDTDPSASFELASVQAGILVNPAILNGGNISVSILPGTSGLVSSQQPNKVTWVQSQNCIKLNPRQLPGAGAGTILSQSGQGTRVCRLRVTNSLPFAAGSQANLSFNFANNPYPTKVFRYISGLSTQIVSSTANTFSTCANPLLNSSGTTVNMSVLLEGLYAGSGIMNPADDANGIHWGNGIADKITVELHSGSNYASVISTVSNIDLLINGTATFTVPGGLNGSYYITVKHRNSITTVSANPVSFATGPVSYNFTDNSVKAFGGNMFQMTDGKWAIHCGDVNQDGIVDGDDLSLVDNKSALFEAGYVVEDVNGDGLVDGSDMSVTDNKAASFVGISTP